MAVAEQTIKIVKPSPSSREDRRDKANFDSSMVIIRDLVHHTSRDGAEYFFREMMKECHGLSRRFGLKLS